MSTIRVSRRDRFVVIEQDVARDVRLSLRARGLLLLLLSYPDNWRINADQIARTTREGRDAVRRCIAELEEAGYMLRSKCQVAGGRWVTELVLRESPGETDDGFSVVGATRADDAKGQVAPTPGKPTVGKPGAYRNTVTRGAARARPVDNSNPNVCTLCSGIGWVDFDEDTRTWLSRCSCVNVSRRRRR